LPNNIVVGGVSGIAIVVNELFGISSQLFIYIAYFILLFISYIFLDIGYTKRVFLGTLLYPLFITFTAPIAKVLITYLSFEEILVTVVLAGLLHGVAEGIVYRIGYSTGGSDVLIKLICKYAHFSEGKSLLIFNVFIILCGAFVFGVDMAVYAVIIQVISSYIVDKISTGISTSKKFMIYTRKPKDIKHIIEDEFKAGFTIFPTIGGYSHLKGAMIMCVIRNRDVNLFKDRILEEDKSAFFVISDCYEVKGGIRRSNLPFI
jgi:uncharacterized membrane-anchored protein YitT (DUF2179 family)